MILISKKKYHDYNHSLFQKNVFAVGMVCCDGEGRVNEKSILLQCRYKYLFFSGAYLIVI